MLRSIALIVFTCILSAGAYPAGAQQATQSSVSDLLRRNLEVMAQREKALKDAEERLQPEHPEVATALNNLAEAHRFAATFTKDDAERQREAGIAEAMHGRALRIREKALGPRHSFTLASMVNLGHVYQLQRRYDDAEAMFKRAMAILNDIGPRAGILTDLARQASSGLSQIDTQRQTKAGEAARLAYANPDHRWSISYPGDWKLDDNDRFFVKLSKGPAIFGVHTFTDAAGTSLEDFADAALRRWEKNMQGVNVFTQISRQRVNLPGGLPAIEVVHHIGRGVLGKSRKVIAVVKDRAFLIDAETGLASWPDYERDFDRITGSFTVRE